jgi:hypothetical protein
VHLADGHGATIVGDPIRQLEDHLGPTAPPQLDAITMRELSLGDFVAVDGRAIAGTAVTQFVAVTDGDDFCVVTRDFAARQMEVARDPPTHLERILRDFDDTPT